MESFTVFENNIKDNILYHIIYKNTEQPVYYMFESQKAAERMFEVHALMNNRGVMTR